MTITFHLENWNSYYSDPQRELLWREHYEELAEAHGYEFPMGPDVEAYSALDRVGVLVIISAREAGKLVGYCLVVAKRHLHYPILCGFEDSYFLTRSARKGSVGYRLIKAMLQALHARGCKRSYWMTKEFASVAKLFERLGMVKMDSVYVAKGI